MRRDLIHFFLVGVACSTLLSLMLLLASENIKATIGVMVATNGTLLIVILAALYRRRTWRRMGRLPDDFRSRELRCPGSTGTRSHRFIPRGVTFAR